MTSAVAVNEVIDVEWKFGVTAASSELKKVGSTFMQVKLILDAGNGQQKNVYFEMTLQQFYAFLHGLGKAKASLDYLE